MQALRYPHRKKDRQPVAVPRANKRVRKGDTVEVISGRETSKTGKVLRIITKSNRCIVEKINLVKKHRKPTQKNPQGGIEEIEGSIHLSNVRLVTKGSSEKGAGVASEKPTTSAKKKTSKKKTRS